MFFLAGSVYAFDFGLEKDSKPKTELDKNADSEKTAVLDEQDTEGDKEGEEISATSIENNATASDSTHNSVNKYNFILYYIYKHKYDSRSESLRNFLN